MEDNNSITVEIGDTVKHRYRDYPPGIIIKLLDGCNAVCWVDFGEKVMGKTHLTICISTDIVKVN